MRYKGYFGYIAPVWVTDPYGECYIEPRHIGYVLYPIADFVVNVTNFILSALDSEYEPHYPIIIKDTSHDK